VQNGISTLSEREKATLRLLVSGHDAKSIARHFGLSVHTVNERLRNARRKLGVSSSREAARLLIDEEAIGPQISADKQLGVAPTAQTMAFDAQADHWRRKARQRAWLGGFLVMIGIIAAVLFLAAHDSDPPSVRASAASTEGIASESVASESANAARSWIAFLDAGRWEESWGNAGSLFRSQILAAQWVATIKSVRQPLGKSTTRTLQRVTRSSSLPGAPAGEYEVVEFQTNFAQRQETTETVVLAREASGWKVVGYFVR